MGLACRQPLVPVLSISDGRWLLSGALQLMGKPGGHGAIWKLMRDEGIFAWMRGQVSCAMPNIES